MRILTITLLACALFVSLAHAQSTTATLRGVVQSATDSQPMAEAEVTLVHEPSGNVKTTTSNTDGAFVFTGLRVGGPYHLTAKFGGFKDTEEKGIFLSAGRTVDVTLGLKLEEEVIEVTSSAVPRTTSGRLVITAAEIEALPSIDRDPRDMVRRTPEVTVSGASHVMSVGGMNPRFNSITIDGLRMDDDFGLNSSGYPTNRSPIPLAAIEELAVEQSPFDVRYGKFLGGNVNIITKSGTNDIHGSMFGSFSSDALLGHKTDDQNLPDTTFHEYRYGAEIAGPILHDKLHFVLAIEGLSASTPTSVGPLGSGAANITSKVTQDEVAMAQQIAKQVYGFEAGDPSRSLDEGNVNVLAKVDYAINQSNRLTASFLRNSGNQIESSFATDQNLPLTSNWYNAVDTLNSLSLRWFSDVTDKLSTEVSASAKSVSALVPPLNGNGFMAATILTPEKGEIILGPDDFRHTNELDNDLLQLRVVANYLAGKHLITGGIEYELLHVHNLFIPDTNGAAQYASLADFMNKNPSQIFYETSTTLNPQDAAANFNTGTITPYLQDQFRLSSDLTVTGGLRLEVYQADQNIVENPLFVQNYGFSNTATLNGRSLLEPRVGISYLATQKLNLRAGGGLYSGGTPSVWVANGYQNDGVRIGTAFDTNPADIQGFDGRHIPTAVQALVKANSGDVDALDPNFKLPSAWKIGTGADWELPYGAVLKLNYVYTKVREGVTWVDLRRCETPTSSQAVCDIPNAAPLGLLPDGRYYYNTSAFPTHIGYDMELTNSNQGYGHTASAMLSKGFGFGLFLSAAYAYQHVMDINPANSSRSVSNYDNLAVFDPNAPDLARSSYEVTHRFTLALEYSHSLIGDLTDSTPWKYLKTSFGMFADSHSGQPFSWTFGDSSAGGALSKLYGEDQSIAKVDRMLFYVPKGDGSDVILNGIDPATFNAFLHQTGLDKYRGEVAPANVFTGSWLSRVDIRFAQELPNPLEPKHRARFVMDIQNVGNLLDSHWGRVSTTPFPYDSIAVDVARDPATGKYIYSNLRAPNQSTVDVLSSVWKMSLGLAYDF